MSAKATAVTFSLTPTNNERLAGLCGQLGAHIKQIESYLGVHITNRGSAFIITGQLESAENAERVLQQLYRRTEGNTQLSAETVHRALRQLEQKGQKMMDDPSLVADTPKRKVP